MANLPIAFAFTIHGRIVRRCWFVSILENYKFSIIRVSRYSGLNFWPLEQIIHERMYNTSFR